METVVRGVHVHVYVVVVLSCCAVIDLNGFSLFAKCLLCILACRPFFSGLVPEDSCLNELIVLQLAEFLPVLIAVRSSVQLDYNQPGKYDYTFCFYK